MHPHAENLLDELDRLLAALHAKIPQRHTGYTSWKPGRRNSPPSKIAADGYAIRKREIYNYAFGPMRPQIERLLRKLARLHVFPVIHTEQPLDTPLRTPTPAPMAHITLSDEVRRMLELCTFAGHVVKMPQMDRKLYDAVNRVLNNAGGKWDRRAQGHVFPGDPREKLGLTLQTGKSIDEKKQYQAFYTPVPVARRILQGISYTGKRVLEPSAGDAAFADLLRLDAAEVICCELNPEAAEGLRAKGHHVVEGDFLTQTAAGLGGPFDVVVMNPPFAHDQDIRHVHHAYSMLRPGGELIAIVSPGYTFGETSAKSNFRQWLADLDATESDLTEGTFAESGTPIRTRIIALFKPADATEESYTSHPLATPNPSHYEESTHETPSLPARGAPSLPEEGHLRLPLAEVETGAALPSGSQDEARPQGQSLDGVDLQEILDSAKNAADLGKQQYFTPVEAAEAFAIPLPRARHTFVDLMMGAGSLLVGAKPKRAIGVDIDRRFIRTSSKFPEGADLLQADITKLYPLLAEVNWQYDLGGFNPPFSLQWETARFAALAESQVPAVQATFKPGRETIDSTLATMLMALDRQTPSGEAYLICNESTACKLFGDPDNSASKIQNSELRSHIWLWLTVPAGLSEGTSDLTTAVLYFARGHDSAGRPPLHLTSPSSEATAITATLETARSHRALMRKGRHIYSEDQCCPTTGPIFRAAAAEYRRLYSESKIQNSKFNIWLTGGVIHRHLTPFQNFSGKIPKKDIATLNDIQGQTPMSLVVQKPTRLALQRAVRSEYWRVDPELLAAVEQACTQYAAQRAPFYPLSETQRIGFLDEEDSIVCKQDLRSIQNSKFKIQNSRGFTAGRTYSLETQTRKIEHSHTRPNILGNEESVTLHGQELVIRIKDDAGIWWEFATFTDEELKNQNSAFNIQNSGGAALKLKLELLPQHFAIPAVPDVAQLHPAKYEANLAALRALEARDPVASSREQPDPSSASILPIILNSPTARPLFASAATDTTSPSRAQPTKKGTFHYRAYQIDDLARAAIHDGLVFAWDKGLGKTCALYSFSIVKGARRTLIVAPEALHEQIIKEGLTMFGEVVRPLLSQAAYHQDAALQTVARDLRNGREESAVTGWWITSYTALGYNGADEWLGKEDDNGEFIVSPKMKLARRRDPLWKSEADEKGIGEVRTYEIQNPEFKIQHSVRCVYQPSLATLVRDLFDCVTVDEAVRLKSDESYISLGVRQLRPRFRLVLTGTPIKNHLDDIFWLAHWACGGHAEPCARWPYANSNSAREEFANTHMFIEENHTREEASAEHGRRKKFTRRIPQICNVHRLWKLLAPAVLCRRKQDIGEDLVSKTIVPIRVRPGKAQNTVYKFHVDNPPDFARGGQPMNPVARIVAQLQNLRQAALCPHTTNLSSAHIRLERVAQILREEAHKSHPSHTSHTSHATDAEGYPLRHFDQAATTKAILVARKGESCKNLGPNYAGEAAVALAIVERMMAGSTPIDLDAIFAAAPSLLEKLKPAIVIESNAKSSRSWTDHTPKQAAILKLIEELIAEGEQVVVMSPFKAFSEALHRRLVEAGVSVCLLDGSMTPAKRGIQAAAFKRAKFAVLIGGQKSMGEGHSFECAAHLIMPSLDWAFDTNSQCEDRVHRLTSRKPVKIYAMVTENTVDTRLQNLYEEKSDSASLALFAELSAANTGEINLGKLLGEAIANFDPHAETIDELDIEREWETSLKSKLRAAEAQFRKLHPLTTESRTTDTAAASPRGSGILPLIHPADNSKFKIQNSPLLKIVRALRDATYTVLRGVKTPSEITALRQAFEQYCSISPLSDWRAAWRAFEAHQRKAPARPSANSKAIEPSTAVVVHEDAPVRAGVIIPFAQPRPSARERAERALAHL